MKPEVHNFKIKATNYCENTLATSVTAFFIFLEKSQVSRNTKPTRLSPNCWESRKIDSLEFLTRRKHKNSARNPLPEVPKIKILNLKNLYKNPKFEVMDLAFWNFF
jgi:hypothetical protein